MTVEYRTISCHDAGCHCGEETGRMLELAGLTEAFEDVDLNAKFDQFNARLFSGSLPKIPCTFRKMKGMVGGVCEFGIKWPDGYIPNSRMKSISPKVYYKRAQLSEGSITITINNTFKRTSNGLDAILIHEMIHAYLACNGDIADNHGPEFKKLATSIGEKVGYTIPLTDKTDDLELAAEKPKEIGVFVMKQRGQKPVVAIATPKVTIGAVPVIMERWGSYGAIGYDIRVIIVASNSWTRWAEAHAVQRSLGTFKDKRYRVEDPQLLADLDAGKVLLHIEDTKGPSS